jgi:hypothetical protein
VSANDGARLQLIHGVRRLRGGMTSKVVPMNRLLVLAFVLHLGCGGGSEPTTTTPPSQVVKRQGTGTAPPPDAGAVAGVTTTTSGQPFAFTGET